MIFLDHIKSQPGKWSKQIEDYIFYNFQNKQSIELCRKRL